jgi:hypothetical protein
MKEKIEPKEKDNIILVSQIIFNCISPNFEKPSQIRTCERFGFKYNLKVDKLSEYTSCIKAIRGINNRTFNISQRNKEIIEFITDLRISELENLVNLNNSNKDFDLHKYLKEENDENKN